MKEKIIIEKIQISEGHGKMDNDGNVQETSFSGIGGEELWSSIAKVINETCVENQIDYRYLGHYIIKEITKEPSLKGSMGNTDYYFDWILCVVMERETYESGSTCST